MKSISKISLFLFITAAVGLGGCDKNKLYDIVTPPSQVHFNGSEIQNYSTLPTPDTAHTVYVGTTDIATEDRTFNVVVTSTTGATVNNQYTLSSSTVTIPKGSTTGSFQIKGDPSDYLFGRKDTLVVAFGATNSLPVAGFLDTIRVALRGPCQESEIVFSQLGGAYTKTFENASYGPYTSTIASISSTGATTFQGTVTNIYDNNISAVASFDYTTPGAFTVSIAAQPTNLAVGGLRLYVETYEPGSFTYCTNFVTLKMRLFTTAAVYDEWVMTMGR